MTATRGFRPFERSALAQSIGARFEGQVALDPGRLAVRCAGASRTYAELNASANQLAHAILAACGTQCEPVVIAIDQGVSLLASVLGVLKAGKTYVPLEIAQPRDRVGAMLRDSQARLAIAPAAAQPLLRELASEALRCIDPERLDPLLPQADPALAVAPDAPACIYYTTGSTGQPKGVVDSHRNVLHNVMRYTNGLRISGDDRLTLLQSPSFSGAVSSMFCALLNGAASFPFDIRHSTATDLADYVSAERITIYHSVPTIFRSFLGGDRMFPSVRIIRLEGDQATALDVELFRRHFASHCVLVNGLGTTETGIVCRHVIPHDAPRESGVVPVGHVVDDMEVLIVGDDLEPVPKGATGEIAVRSDYLALCYWNRPDLTARAFLPARDGSARRMYRTGDLGRMRPDGCVEHLGRRDFRVKIRGETVDIADVEAAMHQLPMIREAAVDARIDARGEKRLYACFVCTTGDAPTVSVIRRAISRALPPSQVPAWYAQVEALPLNENRKIDRRALPARSRERPRLEHAYAPPRDPTQSSIAQVWEAILDVEPVGIHDDFLDLGGDSLLAAQMISQVANTLGIEIPLSVLTAGSTIEHLALAIAGRERPHPAIVPLRTSGANAPFYFFHGDYLGYGAYCREIAKWLEPDRPFYAMTPCGLDGEAAPDNVEAMAERHLRALAAHRAHGPYLLGGNCNGGLIALEVASRLVAAGERVDRLIIFRTSARNAGRLWLFERADRIGRRLQLPPAGRRALARRLRWLVGAWDERGAFDRLQLLARKIPAAARMLVRLRRVERDHAGSPVGGAPAAVADREALIAAYGVAAADYIPCRYPGRIDLFWPESDAESSATALRFWKRISPDVRLTVVPGDHLTALTKHAQEFAQRLVAEFPAPSTHTSG